MALPNTLNVYSGPDSLIMYHDPSYQPLLPLVEIPASMNPFKRDGVRIFAKMFTALPTHNIKALPVLNMLRSAGDSVARKTIIEPSSGSTAMSMSVLSKVLYKHNDVHAYVSNKIDTSQLKWMRFFGAKVELHGGAVQADISDRRDIIDKARRQENEDDDFYNPGHYTNNDSWKSHSLWTGPQLLAQLPNIRIFCAGMGSAGCVTGTGSYLKHNVPGVTILGVCSGLDDPVPGARPFQLLSSCEFPWKSVVDIVEESSSVHAYRISMKLCREGLICGPSSGLTLNGLYKFLQREKTNSSLRQYADESGTISCVFTCCDLPYQYLDNYYQVLDNADFPPLINQNLLHVDTGTYDPRWELTYEQTILKVYDEPALGGAQILCKNHRDFSGGCEIGVEAIPDGLIFDLRQHEDFCRLHLRGALSVPLTTLSAAGQSPFDNASILEAQWSEIRAVFCEGELMAGGFGWDRHIVFIDYTGETARLASSVIREKGWTAFSVKGGLAEFLERGIELNPQILAG